jgi:SAM-dependent methyltransferase
LVALVDAQCKRHYEIDAPIPDPVRRIRVAGTDNLRHFNVSGGQWYGALVEALDRVSGRTFDDFRDVLDWGCGCGRVLRYVSARHAINLIGVDIDADAIGWCKSAFPTRTFHAIGLDPPLPLPANSVDLVYGMSVFTHLSECNQFKWLEELRRVSRPGGMLLLSVHGDHAWFRSARPAVDFCEWKSQGFLDLHRDDALKDVISDPDYYRTVFHDMGYVIREWGKYFRVVEYIPGVLQNHQDLVVLLRE